MKNTGFFFLNVGFNQMMIWGVLRPLGLVYIKSTKLTFRRSEIPSWPSTEQSVKNGFTTPFQQFNKLLCVVKPFLLQTSGNYPALSPYGPD